MAAQLTHPLARQKYGQSWPSASTASKTYARFDRHGPELLSIERGLAGFLEEVGVIDRPPLDLYHAIIQVFNGCPDLDRADRDYRHGCEPNSPFGGASEEIPSTCKVAPVLFARSVACLAAAPAASLPSVGRRISSMSNVSAVFS